MSILEFASFFCDFFFHLHFRQRMYTHSEHTESRQKARGPVVTQTTSPLNYAIYDKVCR